MTVYGIYANRPFSLADNNLSNQAKTNRMANNRPTHSLNTNYYPIKIGTI